MKNIYIKVREFMYLCFIKKYVTPRHNSILFNGNVEISVKVFRQKKWMNSCYDREKSARRVQILIVRKQHEFKSCQTLDMQKLHKFM